ncbi:hypothetical protein BJ322DRAFT_180037 [Thelephora terrestris]|uniref:NB-ARC domain-containing protein n=1 Tax=Thelephora terrestris TaxID=56493 RepID=A0A9P6L5C7_9AGAM|nr:hypothetical protein BJ322DRAFT_180037 [Thelephora terrestris]
MMVPKPQRQKGRDAVFSKLNEAIEDLNRAKEVSKVAPAKTAFGSTSVLLPTIRDSMADRKGWVELGLACADVCRSLDRGLSCAQTDRLSRSVSEAIEELTATVVQIQRNVVETEEQDPISRILHAKNNKATIVAWRSDLDRILHVFETELALHNHVALSDVRHDVANTHEIVSDIHHDVTSTRELVSDIHRTMVKGQEGNQTIRTSQLGESPPPPPRACFGRDKLIEEIIGLVETLTPIALIGAGGIGKTSLALTVLHDDRIKKRFIRCDQFQAARANFLKRLSEAIGAGVENPKDLTPLRPFLSSKEMLIVLDNAESILDPQGTDAREIYAIVEDLSRFENICLCITSRILTVPPHCDRPVIPTLSMDSACDVFYGIYKNGGRSDIVKGLVRQLDFHALSITLLATTAVHNAWDHDRLAEEWGTDRAQVLRTDYNESLEATIELSLASPTFRKLGPNARELLRVVAFFPKGINEKNLDWLFPTISDRRGIFDKFCALSLTYRSNSFIGMLAPLRDYLGPRDPSKSPLLCTTKDRYISRLQLLGDLEPDQPGFRDSKWIRSEDVNVEHLLYVFTSLVTGSENIWDACANFIAHLFWHKPRSTMLRPMVEDLADDHHSKSRCLFGLSRLFGSIGNHLKQKQLLTHVLELERGQGNDGQVARALRELADTNRFLFISEEGIKQLREALEIDERLCDAEGQAKCWSYLAWSLFDDGQLEAAEEAGSKAMNLFLDQGREYWVCRSHRLLGLVYSYKGERGKAIQHFEAAIRIASPFDWHSQLFWSHFALADLFNDGNGLGNAQSHIEQAKLHAVDNAYSLGHAMEQQARIWRRQGRLQEAKAEALGALETFEQLGATIELGRCRNLLQDIELAE